MLKSLRALALLALGMILGASAAVVTAAPLPFLSGRATITRITTAISTDQQTPTITVEAQALDDGVITGGACSIHTANAKAAQQLTVGSIVKLVLGGK